MDEGCLVGRTDDVARREGDACFVNRIDVQEVEGGEG